MLLIPTTLKPSVIHGIGVFTEQPIKEGEMVYAFHPRIDRIFAYSTEILAFPVHVQRFLYHYLWRSKRPMARNVFPFGLHGDDARFINHSSKSNLRINHTQANEYSASAKVEINSGEELLWDYKDFDNIDLSEGNIFEKIRENCGIERDAYDDWVELGIPLPS